MSTTYPTASRRRARDRDRRGRAGRPAGRLVVLPTDTVYGIGADAFDHAAVQALLDAKGRGREMPPPVLISAGDHARRARHRRPAVRRGAHRGVLARAADPGLPPAALPDRGTSVTPAAPSRSGCPTTRSPWRCSSAPARWRSARPTSAACPPPPRPTRPTGCSATSVAVVLDGGPSPEGEASTILDVTAARSRGCCAAARSRSTDAQRGRWSRSACTRHRRDRLRTAGAPVREYLLVFLVAAAATYLLTVIAREIALRTGAVARVRDRDVHAEPIPYLGGLAMLGGLVAAYVVAQQLPFLSRSGPFVFHDARIVLIAGAMICAIGTLDDLFELDALTKLGGQVLAAGFLVLNGIQYIFFPLPGGGQFSLDPRPGRAADRLHRGRRP